MDLSIGGVTGSWLMNTLWIVRVWIIVLVHKCMVWWFWIYRSNTHDWSFPLSRDCSQTRFILVPGISRFMATGTYHTRYGTSRLESEFVPYKQYDYQYVRELLFMRALFMVYSWVTSQSQLQCSDQLFVWACHPVFSCSLSLSRVIFYFLPLLHIPTYLVQLVHNTL